MRRLNPRSFIQSSKTILVELTRIYSVDRIEISWDVRALTLILRVEKLTFNLSLYIYILTFWFYTFPKWRIVWYVHFSIPYSIRSSHGVRRSQIFFPSFLSIIIIITVLFCLSLSSTLLCFLATSYTSNTGYIFFFF